MGIKWTISAALLVKPSHTTIVDEQKLHTDTYHLEQGLPVSATNEEARHKLNL